MRPGSLIMAKQHGTVYHPVMFLKAQQSLSPAHTLLALLVLLLFGLALDLPGLRALPVTDRDEARYAQASRQMVETGDYLRIRFLNEARNKKPAGIYWLQAAAVKATGVKEAIWPYRLVSVAGALAAVWLVYLLGRRLLPAAPLLPAVALTACPLLVIVAHAATTDAVLLACTCAAQGCLASIYLSLRQPATRTSAAPRARGVALGFWLALGLGILIKGPVTPLIVGLTILALCLHDRQTGWLRRLHPGWGVPVLLALVVPWLLAIQHATGGAFLKESMGQDFADKLQGVQESHGALPGAYLLAVNVLFWPLFPLAWRGIGQAWRTRRRDPVSVFLLAWLVPSWLVFELAPTKLPHYVLPLYPALAFLALRWLGEAGATVRAPAPTPLESAPHRAVPAGRGDRLWQVTCRVVDGAWWVVAFLLVVGPVMAGWLLGWTWLPAAGGCAVVAVMATIVFRRRRRAARQESESLVAIAAGFALLYFGLFFGCVLPHLDDLWLTRRVADMVQRQAHALGRPLQVISIGYAEPSLAFTLGTATRLNPGIDATIAELRLDPMTAVLVQDAAPPPPKLLPVSDALWARLTDALTALPKHCCRQDFLAAAERAGLAVREVGSVDGFDYSRTRRLRVLLYMRPESKP